VPKPANLTFEQAAAVPVSGCSAVQGRDQGRVQLGQKVLIHRSGGRRGVIRGAAGQRVRSGSDRPLQHDKEDLVRSIGAHYVLDYTRDDGSQRYDVILDTAGRRSLSHLRCALAPRGTLVIVGGDGGGRWLGGFDRQILRAPLLSLFVSQTLRPLTSKETREDLVVLKEHTEAGKVTPAIDTTYPLHEVPEAIHYLGCNRWQSVGGGCWTTCIAGWP
jgi:NADPH:quinone reductase-like Zn-dependent oxidoreductase